MGRRVGRPGLIGTMARTAVIAGTAQAVGGNVARRQQARAAEAQAPQAYAPPPPQAYSAPAETPASPAGGDDMIAQLSRLGDLHAQGILDDAEFAAAKARLLA